MENNSFSIFDLIFTRIWLLISDDVGGWKIEICLVVVCRVKRCLDDEGIPSIDESDGAINLCKIDCRS